MEASRLPVPRGLSARARRNIQPESWSMQLRWFGAAVAVGFSVPYLGSSILDLHHDLYLGVYFVSVIALCVAYASRTALDLRATVSR